MSCPGRPVAEDTLSLGISRSSQAPKLTRLDARVSAPAPRVFDTQGDTGSSIPVAELRLGINYEWQSSQ